MQTARNREKILTSQFNIIPQDFDEFKALCEFHSKKLSTEIKKVDKQSFGEAFSSNLVCKLFFKSDLRAPMYNIR